MQSNPVKHYKSLGQMLKAGDFETLNNDLIKMKEAGELKDLQKTTSSNPISEFDDLLFFFPQYAVKKEKNEKGEEIQGTELLPGAMDFLKFALSNGANPNAYMKNGENTFLKSCELQNTEILNYLIKNDFCPANVNHQDGMCNDALFYATMAQATNALEYLVREVGMDINRKNFLDNNRSALFYACGYGLEKSIDKLLELGADPTLKDMYNYQPYEMMLPAYDEEAREEFAEEPEELAMWDNLYQKMIKITQEHAQKKKASLKTKF